MVISIMSIACQLGKVLYCYILEDVSSLPVQRFVAC